MKLLCFTLCFLLSLSAKALTTNCPSLDATTVQAFLNALSAGDTGILPAGTNHWTNGVSWAAPANVTLLGAGTTNTGGDDKTVIIDDFNSGSSLLVIGAPATGYLRVSGITVQSGTATIAKDGGTIVFYGPGTGLILDHCHWVPSTPSGGANYKFISINNGLFGVMHHCIGDFTDSNAIYIQNGRQGPTNDFMGNYEWSLPTDFGTSNAFFLEDNIFISHLVTGSQYSGRVYDMFTAAKGVLRFNTLSNICGGETHDTGHSQDDRGARSQEYYGNLATSALQFSPNATFAYFGNGTALAWGNSIGGAYDALYKINFVRRAGQSGGTSYNQQPTPDGWGYAGTNFNGTGSLWDGGTLGGTNLGNGYPALDQPGRGQGDLLTGVFPAKVNSVSGTIQWPHQALEPIYIWMNTGNPVGSFDFNISGLGSSSQVVEARDFYYDNKHGVQTSPTSPFDGSSGEIGYGTLANRPTTCTPGVAYWATDQGNWNQSSSNPYGVQQSGAQGVLYKATATNTWTLYYTPYTYPHPLQGVSGGGVTVLPGPTNVRMP